MKDETREKLNVLKERVIHPFGHRGHGSEEGRKAEGGKGISERQGGEHKVDDTAGSEFLKD